MTTNISTKLVQTRSSIVTLGMDSKEFNGLHVLLELRNQGVTPFQDSPELLTALKKSVSLDTSFSTPLAILCDFDFLVEDNFQVLKSLQSNTDFQSIPFIVLGKRNSSIDVRKACKMGIDDFFNYPVDWAEIEERIQFLGEFKKDLMKENISHDLAATSYKIPLGKRLFDIFFASSVLLALSPVLILISLLIKLQSKGPVIYRSKRVGTAYQVFDFLKFRSMCQDADAKLKDLGHLNAYNNGQENNGAFVKLTNDPRITKFGRFIRKTSLDELPQLINVIKGDMSIIGNRPLPLYEAKQLTKDQYAQRFLAPAGISGLWQVCPKGKDNLTTDERVGLDIEYAKDFSFLMDFKILTSTLPAMIQKEA